METLIKTNTIPIEFAENFEEKNLLAYAYSKFDEKKYLCCNEDFITSTFSSISDLFNNTSSVYYGLSNKLMANLEKIRDISKLESNWDGEGAPVFSQLLINQIREIIMHLFIQPNVFPLSSGNIQLEAKNNDCVIEIEISETDKVIVSIVDENDKEYIYYDIKKDYSSINEVLRKFYEHKF